MGHDYGKPPPPGLVQAWVQLGHDGWPQKSGFSGPVREVYCQYCQSTVYCQGGLRLLEEPPQAGIQGGAGGGRRGACPSRPGPGA